MKPLLAVVLAITCVLGLTGPASASPGVSPAASPAPGRPPASYFGMHYSAIGESDLYPESNAIGSVRLWDTGTSWAALQPEPDVWRWDTLDRAVNSARAHGDSVLYVMGRTPTWVAKNVQGQPTYTVLSNYPPYDDAEWVAYVEAVATRYQGEIEAYEIWNEMNIGGYYAGTVKDLVRLTRLAARVIHRIDPAAIVTGPSTTVRGVTGTPAQQKYARLGGFRYADVVNVHLYPNVDGTPEDAARMLTTFRARMRAVGVRKPIWNTEMNYGMPHGHEPRPRPLSPAQQAAWVMRNYLLQWSNGAQRVYWYDWSARSFLGIATVGTDGHSPTRAGLAFSTVRRWMRGTVSPCTVVRNTGTWSCRIGYGGGVRGLVQWNPRHKVTLTAPPRTVSLTDSRGVEVRGAAARQPRVGGSPVLFTYRAR